MKTWKIIAMTAGIVILAACGNQEAKNNNQNQNAGTAKNQEKEQEREMNKERGGVFQEAMLSGKLNKCSYKAKNQEGAETEFSFYVEGEKYSSEMVVGGKNFKSIFDGENMYSWIIGEKQGIVLSKSCVDKIKEENKDKKSKDDFRIPNIDIEERFKNIPDIKCEGTDGIDFSVPQDVKFTDQCEMIGNMVKNADSLIPKASGESQDNQQGGKIQIPVNIPKVNQ